jgi:hypothetical protein
VSPGVARNRKVHAPVDEFCRPWVIIITHGQRCGLHGGAEYVSLMDGTKKLLGDKAYDSNSFRKLLREDGITPVIPGRANR